MFSIYCKHMDTIEHFINNVHECVHFLNLTWTIPNLRKACVPATDESPTLKDLNTRVHGIANYVLALRRDGETFSAIKSTWCRGLFFISPAPQVASIGF